MTTSPQQSRTTREAAGRRGSAVAARGGVATEEPPFDGVALLADTPLGGGSNRALGEAAVGVIDDWPYQVHGAVSPSDIRITVGALCASIAQALRGESPALGSFPAYVSARRVVELL